MTRVTNKDVARRLRNPQALIVGYVAFHHCFIRHSCSGSSVDRSDLPQGRHATTWTRPVVGRLHGCVISCVGGHSSRGAFSCGCNGVNCTGIASLRSRAATREVLDSMQNRSGGCVRSDAGVGERQARLNRIQSAENSSTPYFAILLERRKPRYPCSWHDSAYECEWFPRLHALLKWRSSRWPSLRPSSPLGEHGFGILRGASITSSMVQIYFCL